MKKILLILNAVVALEAIYSCNRENEPIDENATTRGSNANDSTEKEAVRIH